MQIVDRDGRPVVWHGVNVSGMEWGAGQPGPVAHRQHNPYGGYWRPAPGEYDNILSCRFNMVRLPISWANLEPSAPRGSGAAHQYNQAYLRALDEIVRQFASRGIRVVLSMHQWGWSPVFQESRKSGKTIHGCGMPVWLYAGRSIDELTARREFFSNRGGIQRGLVDAWRFLAERYANEPAVVGADMLNEPDLLTGRKPAPMPHLTLDDLYASIGSAIRTVNPHILLIFETGNGTSVSGPPQFDNVVYSFHEYPRNWTPEGLQWARWHMEPARRWNVPLWLGEFQAIGDTSGEAWRTETNGLLSWCRNKNVGWTYWAYSACSRPLYGRNGAGPVNQSLVNLLRSAFR